MDEFCETHILGIIAEFSDIVESPLVQSKTAPHPLPERRRCIAAIGDFISLARYSVNGALPQVCSHRQALYVVLTLIDTRMSAIGDGGSRSLR